MAAEHPPEEIERILRTRARSLAAARTAPEADPLELVTFSRGDQHLAVPTHRVTEVLELQSTTRLPGSAPALVAVCAVRGEVVVVADPALLLDAPVTSIPSDHFAVVLDDGTAPLGLLADQLHGVVKEPRLHPVPDLALIAGVTADGVAVFDVPAVLRDPRTSTATPSPP